MNMNYYQNLIELEVGKLERKEIKFTKDLQESSLNILGISNLVLRKLKIEEIYLKSREEQFEILVSVYNNSNISEVITWILMELDKLDIGFLIEKKETMIKLSDKIENWWHSDILTKIYANILDRRKSFLEILTIFSNSSNKWHRRLSLTSLFYYSKQRINPITFEVASQRIKMLLNDEEYYVQKGLGWTIREMYNLYPEKTIEFLEIYIKDISSIAFQSAVEKIPEIKKEEFKEIRKSDVSNPDEFEKKPLYEHF